MSQSAPPLGVLFVCLGNICRSPTAQGVFEARLAERDQAALFVVDSCATSAFHIGKAPDQRACAAARRHGFSIEKQRARQLQDEDFQRFSHILAMDQSNLAHIKARAELQGFSGTLELLRNYDSSSAALDVPDPYYDGDERFDEVIAIIERAVIGLLRRLDEASPARPS